MENNNDEFYFDGGSMIELHIPKYIASTLQNNWIFNQPVLLNLQPLKNNKIEKNPSISFYCVVRVTDQNNCLSIHCPEPRSKYRMQNSEEPSNQDEVLYQQSQVWIDPLRSPHVYNNSYGAEALNFVAFHNNESNNITVNQCNTYITQNICQSKQCSEHDYKKIENGSGEYYPNAVAETEPNYWIQNGDLIYDIDILPEIPMSDDLVRDTIEMCQAEQQNAMLSKQKTVLILGEEPAHGLTIQKIAVNDSPLESIEVEDKEVIIDNASDETCDTCDTFTGVSWVVNDTLTHNNVADTESKLSSTQEIYESEKCKEMFNNSASLEQDMAIHSTQSSQFTIGDEKTLTCMECNKKMKTLDKYNKHCTDHNNPDVKCNKCLKVFSSKYSLRNHYKLHLRPYPCDRCTKSFWEEAELKGHFAKKHSVYKCNFCNYTTHQHEELQTHESSHDDNECHHEELAAAPIETTDDGKYGNCDKKHYPIINDLNNNQVREADLVIAKVMANKVFLLHSKTARKEKKLSKSCDVCTKSFDRIGDLKRHLIEHVVHSTLAKNPVDENGKLSILCEVCRQMTFFKTDKYKEHLRRHAYLPLYQCMKCNKSFSDSSNFSKHKKIHGSTYYQCDLCHRRFNSKKMLTQHMDYHKKNSPLQCIHCDKFFYFKSMLNKHIKSMHAKESSTRFRCRFCHEYYKSLKERWDHEWVVHNMRNVIADCLHCDAKFRKYADLKRHCNAVHNINIPSAKSIKASSGYIAKKSSDRYCEL